MRNRMPFGMNGSISCGSWLRCAGTSIRSFIQPLLHGLQTACAIQVETRESDDRVEIVPSGRTFSTSYLPRVGKIPRVHLPRTCSSGRGVPPQKTHLVGIYHSHPRTEPKPSDFDIANARWPAQVYVLTSLRSEPPEVFAYRITDGKAPKIPIVET